MKIAIESQLTEIKELLNQQGYQTYVLTNHLKIPVHAIIYEKESSNGGLLSYHPSSSLSNTIYNQKGTLMINAHNKTPQEVLNILQRRIYSPLF